MSNHADQIIMGDTWADSRLQESLVLYNQILTGLGILVRLDERRDQLDGESWSG